jgi:hypothetical protein
MMAGKAGEPGAERATCGVVLASAVPQAQEDLLLGRILAIAWAEQVGGQGVDKLGVALVEHRERGNIALGDTPG